MTNNKQRRMFFIFAMAVCLAVTGMIAAFLLSECRQTVYGQISGFCQLLLEEHPESEEMVLSTLKKYHECGSMEENHFLDQYGYRSDYFLGDIQKLLAVICVVSLLLSCCLFSMILFGLHKRKKNRLNELTSYLEEINTGKQGLVIQLKEDDFSKLQDEIYTTVTNLYQTREAALEAKKNFADNLANIAHQLKTPITAAGINLQLMREEGISSGYVERIYRQLERLTALEEALLTLSQIDAGALKLQQSSVDVYTALCLAEENLHDLLVQKDVKMDIPEKECANICGDLEWTMQALMNIMKNCLEHSEAGGTIHCDYEKNPLYTEILIWDEGSGVAGKDMPHIFERFYRGQRASENGVGIGLPLARSIFELENGSLTARNLPEGGACFEIRIYSH